ncbi:neural cell adhesion molecule 1-like [Photinus pyralis]|uniref:neural cell adhesion molecule 1-like n=1 Tax=Photinus pyralis TaxID=7054 RepID=UPI0012673370|nr:neural cell adhesion molecule 1-like [Photinus pyralis]
MLKVMILSLPTYVNVHFCICAKKRANRLNRERNLIKFFSDKPVPRFPHLWKQIEQAWAFIGGDVNLTCEVDANPPAKFEWFRKNRLVTVRDKAAIHEPHRSILQLHANNSIVFGDYKCRATNRLGKLEKFITLQQGVQPDPPDIVRLHEARRHTISLTVEGPDMTNRTIAASMLPSGYRIQYKATEENLDWDHAATADFVKREDNSYTLEELDKDTMYEMRVATRNLAGISEYTNSSIFKTSSATLAATSQFTLLVFLSCPIAFALIL